MSDLTDVIARWDGERPEYDAFGKLVATRMHSSVKAKGFWCETSWRAKETHSLVKKLLRDSYTYDNLSDKVGARCVVRYLWQVEAALEVAQDLFVCHKIERKSCGLGANQVGYLSTHVDVGLRANDPDVVRFGVFRAELQIRTLGQHLWSEMSHDRIYKAIAELPEGLRRRINLMAGLIEVADQEFERLDREMNDEEAVLYRALEARYFTLATKNPDVDLSRQIIHLIRPLYEGLSILEIENRLSAFFSKHEEDIRAVYADPIAVERIALLTQPEMLMLLERLTDDKYATRDAWNTEFPESELRRAAVLFGISFA